MRNGETQRQTEIGLGQAAATLGTPEAREAEARAQDLIRRGVENTLPEAKERKKQARLEHAAQLETAIERARAAVAVLVTLGEAVRRREAHRPEVETLERQLVALRADQIVAIELGSVPKVGATPADVQKLTEKADHARRDAAVDDAAIAEIRRRIQAGLAELGQARQAVDTAWTHKLAVECGRLHAVAVQAMEPTRVHFERIAKAAPPHFAEPDYHALLEGLQGLAGHFGGGQVPAEGVPAEHGEAQPLDAELLEAMPKLMNEIDRVRAESEHVLRAPSGNLRVVA